VLVPPPILGPGTVDDLIADARLMGRKATQRMIMDWQTFGLIDYPQPQGGAGRGKGSKKSVYSANQRKLFRTLIEHRPQAKHIADLMIFPVYLWLYWGDDYVPLRQTRLAMKTYAGRVTNVSRQRAEALAREITAQFAHPDSRETARTKLTRLTGEAIHEGRGPDEPLEQALHEVFDPHNEGLQLGPPTVPISAEALLRNSLARERAARALISDQEIADSAFTSARGAVVETTNEYLTLQPQLAAQAGRFSELFSPRTPDEIIKRSCSDLLSSLGGALLAAEQPR
jgi:hypothetical protein